MRLFNWDNNKEASNKAKHGVSFTEAKSVFKGNHVSQLDTKKEYGELRWNTIGKSNKNNLLNVTTTNRGDTTRIISARKSGKRDRWYKKWK